MLSKQHAIQTKTALVAVPDRYSVVIFHPSNSPPKVKSKKSKNKKRKTPGGKNRQKQHLILHRSSSGFPIRQKHPVCVRILSCSLEENANSILSAKRWLHEKFRANAGVGRVRLCRSIRVACDGEKAVALSAERVCAWRRSANAERVRVAQIVHAH